MTRMCQLSAQGGVPTREEESGGDDERSQTQKKRERLPAPSKVDSIRGSSELEWEFHTKANDGVIFVIAVFSEVECAVTEDADVCGFDTVFKTATDEEVATVVAVHAVTTACKDVRGQADGFDWVAKNKSTVKFVVFFFGCENAVAGLKTDVFGEEVFEAHATAQFVVTSAIRKDGSAVKTKSESWSEAFATKWWWWWQRSHFFAGFAIAHWACDCGRSECHREESNCDFFHVGIVCRLGVLNGQK
jgi:hypothetical protein